MSERNTFEEKAEHVPTPEEILGVLEEMSGGKYRETKKFTRASDGAVYRLDAVGPGTEEGEILEYIYLLKGEHENGDKTAGTQINSMYTVNGMWTGTGPQASLIDGRWVIER